MRGGVAELRGGSVVDDDIILDKALVAQLAERRFRV
jgi:hypothetical protein